MYKKNLLCFYLDFYPKSRLYPESLIPIPDAIRLYRDLKNTTTQPLTHIY